MRKPTILTFGRVKNYLFPHSYMETELVLQNSLNHQLELLTALFSLIKFIKVYVIVSSQKWCSDEPEMVIPRLCLGSLRM